MKKLISFLLLLIYFTVTTGFTVSWHYCMNELDSAKIGFSESEVCGKCGMETGDENGCCRNEVKVVKLQQDDARVLFTIFNFSYLGKVAGNISDFLFTPSYYNGVDYAKVNTHVPPLISQQQAYIKNCVFRI